MYIYIYYMAYNFMYIYIYMEKNMNQGTYKPGLLADYFCTSEIWEYYSIETDEDRGTHFQVVNFE